MNHLSNKLEDLIASHSIRLIKINNKQSAIKPAPNKWSSKEILGHLIDSAVNNMRRFILAQAKSEFVFDGYNHDTWVALQTYNNRNWNDLIDLWSGINLQISHTINNMTEFTLTKQYPTHNLDQISFKQLAASKPASLTYFIEDYIDHLEHHLKQIYNLQTHI